MADDDESELQAHGSRREEASETPRLPLGPVLAMALRDWDWNPFQDVKEFCKNKVEQERREAAKTKAKEEALSKSILLKFRHAITPSLGGMKWLHVFILAENIIFHQQYYIL